uniref:TAT-variant-translocated molybdopterin oxidoreductase n=2 Tax=Roseivirga sp. TaxID=1964215 RepID=UPI0040475E47
MKENQKTYWKGIEQLTNEPSFVKNAEKEFPEYLPINENGEGNSNRRDFLKLMGFGIAAASLAACEAPVRKAIPYLNKPVDVDPSVPNYYASTYVNGGDAVSIVVKTREGRPIKIEGNKFSSMTLGGTNAQVEASVLSLYDKERLTGPMKSGASTDWATLDKEVTAKLNAIAEQGGQIAIVSNTVVSPTTKKAVGEFIAKYPTAQHITYDAASSYGIAEANRLSFGEAMVPSYDFSKAKTIVSVAADFLGTWISPIEFTKQYSKTRKINAKHREMSRHYQFESNLSLTGANADYRTGIRPSQAGSVITAIYNGIAAKAGQSKINGGNAADIAHLSAAINELWANRGASLLVAGSNDPAIQVLVNGINAMLENYGTTINANAPVHFRQGNDQAMSTMVKDLNAGKVKAVIFFNCNPLYDSAEAQALTAGLSKATLKVSTSDRMDETSKAVDYIAPDHHYLEQWNDAELRSGHYSLTQPTIAPLFDTRQASESFLQWAGITVEYYQYLQENWKSNFFTKQSDTSNFQMFWDKSLFDGVFETGGNTNTYTYDYAAAASAGTLIAQNYKTSGEGLELALYQKLSIGTGAQANNPWLQETSDAVTKATWDNYLTVSQAQAAEWGINMVEGNTETVTLTVGNSSVVVPVLVQPGQAAGTVGLALGYGRTSAGRVGNEVGVNAYPFITKLNGANVYDVFAGVSVAKTGQAYRIAQTQTHQTYMNRSNVIQESVLSEYKKDTKAGREYPQIYKDGEFVKPSKISLWKGHDYNNHHWGLAIDMNSCTGCSACTVACQAENNIPVVGKAEVLNRREMAWIRIDRYYSSDAPVDDQKALEKASENPEVTFQPMMCQHCNNAPCETVCPVAATTHSSEGLNQMTYNRCIGTRYCANNCPYKVRRFNWFKYHDNTQFDKNLSMNNDLGKMVLNPDVTVRARGVMEKCTMCVQRIQSGKLAAKREDRRPVDGEINTACASACPADAIVFGDMNDPNSRITAMLQLQEEKDEKGRIEKVVNEDRAYHVLEEINVNPNVWYFTKIRNKEKQTTEA